MPGGANQRPARQPPPADCTGGGCFFRGDRLPDGFDLTNFDYVKIGSYKQELGGLASSKTNQRMYRLANGKMEDITALFWEKPLPCR